MKVFGNLANICKVIFKKKILSSYTGIFPFFSKNFRKRIKKPVICEEIEKSNLITSNSILLTSKVEKNLINKTVGNFIMELKKVLLTMEF